MINTCEELYPGYRYFSCSDFRVLKGINFNETLASEYLVEIQETSKISFKTIEFIVTISSKTLKNKTHYHFRALIKLVREIPNAPIYESVNLSEDNIITTTGKSFYQNGETTLFHGPAFQQITRILNINPEKITVECFWQKITDQQQGQFPIKWSNPYITDLSTQPLWIWLNHFHQEVCLPGQLTTCEQFLFLPCNQPFYVTCEIKAKTESGVTANYILHNNQGQIYLQILQAKAVIWPIKLLKQK
jgi:hypothetical protein